MNQLDTDIDNYSNADILDLLKIPEQNCTLDTLFLRVAEILDLINETCTTNKKNLLVFFRKCFYKLCRVYQLSPTEYMIKTLDQQQAQQQQAQQHQAQQHQAEQQQAEQDLVPKRDNFIGALPPKVPELATISSNVDKYARGLVNPLQRETVNTLLTINSKFRTNEKQTTTTDFSVLLTEPINNVVALKLASVELMNSYYAVSDYLKTNIFTIETYKINTTTQAQTDFYKREIQLSEGGYNSTLMVSTLNALFLADPSLNMVSTSYNARKGRIYFFLNPPLPPPAGTQYAFNLYFSISAEPTRPLFLNFGWLLGFKKAAYIFTLDYTSAATSTKEIGFNPESPLDFTGTKFFLLEVTDYNNNAPAVLKYNTNDNYWFNIQDILARIPNVSPTFSVVFEDSSDRVFKTRKYFGPVKLQKLRIRLLDENGRVIDLNGSEVVVSFDVEALEVPYKNKIQ